MSGMKHAPEADIEELRNLLNEQYVASSVLKELIQNADDSKAVVLADWQLLKQLNNATLPRYPTGVGTSAPVEPPIAPGILVAQAQRELEDYLRSVDHRFFHPEVEPLALLWPPD